MNSNSNSYINTVNYLYGLQKHGIKLGLTNTLKLMSILKEPQKTFHSIHIAGTNGKGSTATALASILSESGLKVGLFTSPHLVSFTERISINNTRISEKDVIGLASEIRNSITDTDLNPTFFEFVTAIAFYYFAKQNIDWAVIETGLGGRLDATNVLQPDLTIITNISLDHSEFLGNTISDITFEKAGIIKPDVSLITAAERPEVIRQLTDIAAKRNSDIHIFNKDYTGSLTEMDSRHISFDYSGHRNLRDLSLPLTGKHQLYNACTAIRACELLENKDITVSDNSIRKGLQNVKLEGRLEIVSQSPTIVLDSAHNPDAAISLADSFKDIFPGKEVILITGIMDDKEIKGILLPLINIAHSVILTKSSYERAALPEKLEKIAYTIKGISAQNNSPSVYNSETIARAIELAKTICKQDSVILVTGSFYTTGEVKELMDNSAVLSDLREYK